MNTMAQQIVISVFALATPDNHIITTSESFKARPGVCDQAHALRLAYPQKAVLFIDDEGYVANIAPMTPGHSVCDRCDIVGYDNDQICGNCGGSKVYPTPAVHRNSRSQFLQRVDEVMEEEGVEDKAALRKKLGKTLAVVADMLTDDA